MPLMIELFAGLHGWGTPAVELGYRVVGFDIVDMCQALNQPRPPGIDLVLQDVRTLHGSQFREADLLVCSPPCPEYSYMAQPWKRGKDIAAALRGQGEFPDGYEGSRTLPQLNALFDACFRIQRQAIDASQCRNCNGSGKLWPGVGALSMVSDYGGPEICGWCSGSGKRYIPMVVENVKGAQPWVGKAKANFGSFYLWGDVERIGRRIVRSGPVSWGMESVAASGRGSKLPGNNTPRMWSDRKIQRLHDASATRLEMLKRGIPEPDWMKEFGLPGEEDPHGTKNNGNGTWFGQSHGQEYPGQPGNARDGAATSAWRAEQENGVKCTGQKHGEEYAMTRGATGTKQTGDGDWFDKALDERRKQATADSFGWSKDSALRNNNSRSDSRKAASAAIAKIPPPLARHIARIFKPGACAEDGKP